MSNTFFVDQEHEEQFKKLVTLCNKAQDREYSAAIYILTSDMELRRKAAIHIKSVGIDWRRIDKTDWSTGYGLIVELAKHLFRSSGNIELAKGLYTWGDNLYRVAMQAIHIRKWGLQQ